MENDVFFEIMKKYALLFNCNIHTLNLCDYFIYFIAVNTLGGNFFLICRNWPDDLLWFAQRGKLSRDWRGVSPLHTPQEFRPCVSYKMKVFCLQLANLLEATLFFNVIQIITLTIITLITLYIYFFSIHTAHN